MSLQVLEVAPVLRILDMATARAFYLDYLGCAVDWEYRFDPGAPLYLQVSRDGLLLHLTEHAGDAVPGATVFVRVADLHALHRELAGRHDGPHPGVEAMPWGSIGMELRDPFGNRIRFDQAPGG